MVRIKMSEVQGTMNIEETHKLQDKLQTLNEELSQAKKNQHQLEKQLKSTEVSADQII